jgi:hypothetical protein
MPPALRDGYEAALPGNLWVFRSRIRHWRPYKKFMCIREKMIRKKGAGYDERAG